MIHIIDSIYAIPNNMGFTVVRKKDKEDSKTPVTIGYCGDLEEACHLAYKSAVSEKTIGKNMELSGAIQIMKDTKQMIHKALEGLT